MEPLLHGSPLALSRLQAGEQEARFARLLDLIENPRDPLVELRQVAGQPITIARILRARRGQGLPHFLREMAGQIGLNQAGLDPSQNAPLERLALDGVAVAADGRTLVLVVVATVAVPALDRVSRRRSSRS